MSIVYTQVQIVRNGTPVSGLTNLDCQIDTVSLDPRMFDRGAAPFDLFNLYLSYVPLSVGRTIYVPRVAGSVLIVLVGGEETPVTLLRNDVVEDVGSSNSGSYRIANRPEYFSDGHVEIQAFQKVGV